MSGIEPKDPLREDIGRQMLTITHQLMSAQITEYDTYMCELCQAEGIWLYVHEYVSHSSLCKF